MDTEESEDEMFPITYESPRDKGAFVYNDPLLVSGVLRAVVEADLEKIIQLVADGKSLNINDNNGNTPLHVAVINNNLETLKLLLRGEDVLINTKNNFGETPLSISVEHGNFEAVRILIDHGADVKYQDDDGSSLLHKSVTFPRLVNLLILYSADIDIEDSYGNTPLHVAVEKECLETVCMLLCYNADANVLNKFNYTPFMKALLNKNIEIQEVLLGYVDDFNYRSTCDWSTLYIALKGNSPFLKDIIEQGAVIDAKALLTCDEFYNLHHFKLLWRNLKVSSLEGFHEQRVLLKLLTIWNELDSKYVDVILEYSDSLILEALVGGDFGFDFPIVLLTCKTYNITKITCLFLQHGMVLTTNTIVTVFSIMGYCELFTLLLYIDYVGSWPNQVLLPRFLFDVNSDIIEICKEFKAREYANIFDQEMYEHFWRYPCPFQVVEDCAPSLLQLARDAARKYIVNKFKLRSASQYYTYVKYMNISSVYKKILLYEKGVY